MSDFFIGFIVGLVTALPWSIIIVAVLAGTKKGGD